MAKYNGAQNKCLLQILHEKEKYLLKQIGITSKEPKKKKNNVYYDFITFFFLFLIHQKNWKCLQFFKSGAFFISPEKKKFVSLSIFFQIIKSLLYLCSSFTRKSEQWFVSLQMCLIMILLTFCLYYFVTFDSTYGCYNILCLLLLLTLHIYDYF